MKTLIYCIAYGKSYYYEAAQLSVSAIRKQGYTGDFVVLTDKPHDFDGAKTIVCQVPKNELWKCYLRKVVDLTRYDSILLNDSDTLIYGDINRLFSTDGLLVSGNFIPLKFSPGTNYFFTKEEKEKWGDVLGISSGTFSFPGSFANEFLVKLEKEWQKFDFSTVTKDLWNGQGNVQLWDECAMFMLCLRGEIKWDYYPASTIVFPSVPYQALNPLSDSTVGIHFIATSGIFQDKKKTLEWMQTEPKKAYSDCAAWTLAEIEILKENNRMREMKMLCEAILALGKRINMLEEKLNEKEVFV